MKQSLWTYFKAAFNLKPSGMFFSPNHAGLFLVGVLGILVPGVWILGAGLELLYLWMMINNPRFQAVLDGQELLKVNEAKKQKISDVVIKLDKDSRNRYSALYNVCESIISHQQTMGVASDQDRDGLGKLMWIYLKLLLTRSAMYRVVRDQNDSGLGLARQVTELDGEISHTEDATVKQSLESRRDIIKQRIEKQEEARIKLKLADCELARIQEQVQLMKEQSAVDTESSSLSTRIDMAMASIKDTSSWMKDQQGMAGIADFLTDDAPVVFQRDKQTE